ncbi:hypothetical protein [Archangium violaceum]|uniref:hypothetical protein n=1 Tax=Archangium violaceum TaxID=83451 RepID=UPI0036DB718E
MVDVADEEAVARASNAQVAGPGLESSREMRRVEPDTSPTPLRKARWAARAFRHTVASALPGLASVTSSREPRRRCNRAGASGPGGEGSWASRTSGDCSPSPPATAGPAAPGGV